MSGIRATLSRVRRRPQDPSAPRHRQERGATLVEYAVLVAVFVLPAWGGISFLNNTARSEMGTVAAGVASPRSTTTTSPDDAPVETTTTTSTTTTTTSTTTTTTAPPTTTTTQKPTTTTTTQKPTTTTTLPSPTVQDWTLDATKSRGKYTLDTSIELDTPSGGAMKKVDVTFQLERYTGGKWVTVDIDPATLTTSNKGVVDVSISGLSGSKNEKYRLTITGIDAPGYEWDGSNASRTVTLTA